MSFLNQHAFDDPQNWIRSEGGDPNPDRAVVSTNGKVLFYSSTGGMLSPRRYELREGTTLFRFAASDASVETIMAGSWWVERAEFEKILSFATQHGIGAGMAARVLCLVPPQWSDMGRLLRVRVVRPLLAMRGLGSSVSVDGGPGLGQVNLPHANANPARRLHQVFIPGLREPGLASAALAFGNLYDLDPREGLRGWLYL